MADGAVFHGCRNVLFAQSESFHNGAIAVDVGVIKILQHLAATAYKLGKRAGGAKVLVVLLQVLREVLDAESEQSNLALCGTGVCSRLAILRENLLLLCRI